MTDLATLPIEKRFEEACRSRKVWELGICAAMRYFHLPHALVKKARADYLRASRGDVSDLLEKKANNDSRQRLVRAEARYPGILRGLLSQSSAEIGRRYRLTRSCTNRIANNLRVYAAEQETGVEEAVRGLAEEAREIQGVLPRLGRPPKSAQAGLKARSCAVRPRRSPVSEAP